MLNEENCVKKIAICGDLSLVMYDMLLSLTNFHKFVPCGFLHKMHRNKRRQLQMKHSWPCHMYKANESFLYFVAFNAVLLHFLFLVSYLLTAFV